MALLWTKSGRENDIIINNFDFYGFDLTFLWWVGLAPLDTPVERNGVYHLSLSPLTSPPPSWILSSILQNSISHLCLWILYLCKWKAGVCGFCVHGNSCTLIIALSGVLFCLWLWWLPWIHRPSLSGCYRTMLDAWKLGLHIVIITRHINEKFVSSNS